MQRQVHFSWGQRLLPQPKAFHEELGIGFLQTANSGSVLCICCYVNRNQESAKIAKRFEGGCGRRRGDEVCPKVVGEILGRMSARVLTIPREKWRSCPGKSKLTKQERVTTS